VNKDISLLPAQIEFVNSTFRHTGFVAGFGSGKTQGGVAKIIIKKLEFPKIDVAYYLPTYNLIKDIAVPRIGEFLTDLGLEFTINLSDKFFQVYNGGIDIGRIIMRTMDNPALIVGYEVGYSLIDECDVQPKNKMTIVFNQILARNRTKLPDNKKNCVDVVGTPEGFKWFYEFFVTKANDTKVLIKARTQDNPFLPADYIDSLKDVYTTEQLSAYLEGEFVNLTSGNVYRNYDRKLNHTDREIKQGDILHIGMDFNITNMSAVIHVVDSGTLKAVEEIVDAYDTQEMIQMIKDRYKGYSIVVYPDASSGARKTNGKSDEKLLKEARFTIRKQSKNTRVRDRVTDMNVAFLNGKGERSYFVNSNKCIKYTEGLERQPYDKNGAPDKASGYDHMNDAGGYALQGISKKTTKRMIV